MGSLDFLFMTDNESKSSNPAYMISNFNFKRNIIVIGISIILLYFLNNLLYIYVPYIPNDPTGFFWGLLKNMYNHVEIPFLTKEFTNCLWAINLFLLLTILGYFSFLFYNPAIYKKLVYALLSLSAILAFFVVYIIFPFKLDSSQMTSFIKIVLIIPMIGFGLNIIRLLFEHY